MLQPNPAEWVAGVGPIAIQWLFLALCWPFIVVFIWRGPRSRVAGKLRPAVGVLVYALMCTVPVFWYLVPLIQPKTIWPYLGFLSPSLATIAASCIALIRQRGG
jgi:hypothetical protein